MLNHNLPSGITIDGVYDASENGEANDFIILCYRVHDTHPWVVARYDGTSTEWDYGSYFYSEAQAMKYFLAKMLAVRHLS